MHHCRRFRPPSLSRREMLAQCAGGMGMISGRKAFQRPMAERVELLNAIQNVYLCDDVTVA